MDLLHNPFYILNATPRDKRQRIIELSEDRALVLDASVCTEARSVLTNPRKRLSMEIAWLPGLAPKRVAQFVGILEKSALDISKLDKLAPLAKANLLAAGLPQAAPAKVDEWIVALAMSSEGIDPEQLCATLNEERIIAGFPQITDLAVIEEEISGRLRYYCQVAMTSLKKLPLEVFVQTLTAIVDSTTDNGEKHGPILIHKLIEAYEVEVKATLASREESVRATADKLKAASDGHTPDSDLARIVTELIQLTKGWDTIAQPLQLSTRSRGLTHKPSQSVAAIVRDAALHLFNQHQKLEFSQQLTRMLREVFAEVIDVAELTAEDSSVLDEIAGERQQSGYLDPIRYLCRTALENSEKEPTSAAEEAKRIIDTAPQLLATMSVLNANDELVARGKDEIALTLMNLGIQFANTTDKWKTSVSILLHALKYVVNDELRSRIEKNLATARSNEVFSGLTPISSAPSLNTINGIGFRLYGSTDHDRETGSYLATYYFVFFLIPIIPICRYRVISTGEGYRFLGRAPLKRVFVRNYLLTWALVVTVMIGIGLLSEDSKPSRTVTPSGRVSTPGRSVEGRSVEGRSVEGRSVEGRSVEGRSVEGRSVEGRSVQGRPVEGRSEQSRPEQGTSTSSPPSGEVSTPRLSERMSSTRSALAKEIEAGKARARQMERQLGDMDNRINDYEQRMARYESLDMIDDYNGLVPRFNSLINERIRVYGEYSRLVDEINVKVQRHNSLRR